MIAVANAGYWSQGASEEGLLGHVGAALVDGRAYPLFALLLGFGLATSARRMGEGGLDARDAASRLRRRGLWLSAFGAVLGLGFPLEILGAYGLVTLLLAGAVASADRRALVLIGAAGLLLSTAFMVVAGLSGTDAGMDAAPGPEPVLSLLFDPAFWAVNTLLTPVGSLVVPAAVLGALGARSGLLLQPSRHPRELCLLACSGIAVGAVGSLSQGWLQPFASSTTGLVGALGWLAASALLSTRSEASGPLGRLVRALEATGKRSLSAYVLQTPLLLLVAAAVPLGAPAWLWWLLAGCCWSVVVALCALLECHGRRGPLEVLLRRLVSMGRGPEEALGTAR